MSTACSENGQTAEGKTSGNSSSSVQTKPSDEGNKLDTKDKHGPSGLYGLHSVFVGRLALATTKAELYELFKGVGDIKNAFINTPEQGMQFTYGFVRFETEVEARKAVTELNDTIFHGLRLRVELALGGKGEPPCKSKPRPRHMGRPRDEDLPNIQALKSCITHFQRDPTENLQCFPTITDPNGEKRQVSQFINLPHVLSEINRMAYEPVPAFTDEGPASVINIAALDKLVNEMEEQS